MGCGASAQKHPKQRYESDGTEPIDVKTSEFERHDLEGSHARANYSPPGSDAGGAGGGTATQEKSNVYDLQPDPDLKSNVYDSAGGNMSGDPNATTRTGVMQRTTRSYRMSKNVEDGGST